MNKKDLHVAIVGSLGSAGLGSAMLRAALAAVAMHDAMAETKLQVKAMKEAEVPKAPKRHSFAEQRLHDKQRKMERRSRR